MGTPLGPKYTPYSYMDPLGEYSTSDCRHLSGGVLGHYNEFRV